MAVPSSTEFATLVPIDKARRRTADGFMGLEYH